MNLFINGETDLSYRLGEPGRRAGGLDTGRAVA
jgi:hypothetical protein